MSLSLSAVFLLCCHLCDKAELNHRLFDFTCIRILNAIFFCLCFDNRVEIAFSIREQIGRLCFSTYKKVKV